MPCLWAWKLLKLELLAAGSALDFNTFLLSLKRITDPLPQSVVAGLSISAARWVKVIFIFFLMTSVSRDF